MYLELIGEAAKKASRSVSKLSTAEKNNILEKCAKNILENAENIIKANEIDIENAKKNGLKDSLIDRLLLNHDRIKSISSGLIQVASLKDPIGEITETNVLPNKLKIQKVRVPIGVIGIIYEARPNVTSDAFAICLKASSAVILRGGKEAINSNKAIVETFKQTLKELNFDENFVQLIEDTSREIASKMMKMNKYIDLLIPRGGAGLIQTVLENSTIPVIETGVGNCHVFIDETAKIDKAIDIVINAKVQRPSVCNALETLLIHKNVANEVLSRLVPKLFENNVQIRADLIAKEIINNDKVVLASEEDWSKEFLDYILAIKIVEDIDMAIEHIFKYSTKHSEAILTEDYSNANKFIKEVDSAVVYVNSSTRFTDGEEFGFGAEIGISTQKMHARGPMGIKEITSYKYIVLGEGQIRN